VTEIPEHLLKRAAERRAALEAKNAEEPATASGGGAEGGGAAGGGAEGGGAGGGAAGGAEAQGPAAESGGGVTTLERTGGVATGGRAAAPAVGSAGHTQRLLTVVKAGSIQDVKATPTDKVNVWPHLLVIEFAAALAMTAFLTIFSVFVNAPLLQLANPNLTPNPSKAPWYFLGLQEMLTMFHPMVAGVTIPGVALGVLGAAGYIDKNPSHKPEERKLAIALFTFFLMFWAVLVLIGSFFRGEGQNFILPWRQGVHDIFDL
jgi:menaquinol-cytochrome c reductase cytochrome b/c subunit